MFTEKRPTKTIKIESQWVYLLGSCLFGRRMLVITWVFVWLVWAGAWGVRAAGRTGLAAAGLAAVLFNFQVSSLSQIFSAYFFTTTEVLTSTWWWSSTFECSKSPSSWEVNSLSAGISRISLCHAFSSKLNAKWVSDRTCLFCWALWPPGALPPLLLLCLRFFPPPSLPSFFCTSWSLLSSSSFLSLFWKANQTRVKPCYLAC